jgi:hypothetical protein
VKEELRVQKYSASAVTSIECSAITVQELLDQEDMGSDSASEKGVKLPNFDGDSKKFQLWWTRFCAYATVYKFRQALAEGGDSD